jgi:hypothetical protein
MKAGFTVADRAPMADWPGQVSLPGTLDFPREVPVLHGFRLT